MTTVLAAYIDEQNCIGCGKCIRVCPTDAIVGARHLLHTVIPSYCTSCEECINACPTNCINLHTPHVSMSKYVENQLKVKKQLRLSSNSTVVTRTVVTSGQGNMPMARKQLVMDAIARVKARKTQL